MAKMVDYYSDREVQDIMEAFLERFPMMFDGFDTAKIGFVTKKSKGKSKKTGPSLKLSSVGFPDDVWMNKTYTLVASEAAWKKMDTKRKNLSVFKVMCSIPVGGFDEQSKAYGKILPPDFKMFLKEFAASGGVPNWEENPAAKDPMEQTPEEVEQALPNVEAIPAEDGVERKAVTMEEVVSVKVPSKAAKAIQATIAATT
jgi:hypothetical protein